MKKPIRMTRMEEVKQQKCYCKDDICTNQECDYHIDWMETGNCVLRVDREHTLDEIGIAFGFTRERARQVIDLALKKCWVKIVREERYKPKYRKSIPWDFRVTNHD